MIKIADVLNDVIKYDNIVCRLNDPFRPINNELSLDLSLDAQMRAEEIINNLVVISDKKLTREKAREWVNNTCRLRIILRKHKEEIYY